MSAPRQHTENAMGAPDLDALLDQLSKFSTEMKLSEVLQSIGPTEPSSVADARKQCALVRWFDEDLYGFLCHSVDGKPDFDRFTETTEVQRLAPGRWVIEEGARSRLLAAWQSDPSVWKEWNKKIGEYWRAKQGPEAELGAIYHLAASPLPEQAIELFRQWYREADDRFDMAQCNALLEMLRLQDSWRGSALSQVWLDYRQYYSARMLFVEDYYKTGSYFQREEPLQKFQTVFYRSHPDDSWIYHIHATGGTGKTMFLRWLVARYLVPKRVPCARVDFDEFGLDEVVDHPARLFLRVVDQWSQQFHGSALTSLLEKLRREERTPGWNPSVVEEVRRQLQGSGITMQAVVIMDTLEEATISASTWLKQCVDALRGIHKVWPNLILVLSGRYDIAQRSDALMTGEFLAYELPRFSEDEAHRYLESRGIPNGDMRNAIVERAAVDEDSDEQAGPRDKELSGRNPFKLAMFAELALNRTKLTADEVMRFPRVDIAYLLERVVKRIKSQPLRWMVRYGAIARHLTLDFAEDVLLPPLIKALEGENVDKPDQDLASDYKDLWQPDPKAAEGLKSKDAVKALWNQLTAYARERGWLSSTTVEGRTKLRFHPEVINPTRELLRPQDIFPELQQRAVEFFEHKAETSGSGLHWSEREVADSVRNLCEAVFHKFQLEGASTESYWLQKVRAAERFGPEFAVSVAAEITGREYAEAERIPYQRVSSPEILIRAHCEAADLLMQAAALEFASKKNWSDFSRHMELALQIAGNDANLSALIPRFLRAIFDAGGRTSPTELTGVLRGAIPTAGNARERFFIELQLGQALVITPSSEAPVHLREALRILPQAERTGVSTTDIHLELANYYEYEGLHTAVIEAQKQATESAGNDLRARARVLNREAAYVLAVGDADTAESRIAAMRRIPIEAHPSPASVSVLEERLALAKLDPFGAITAATHGLERAVSERDRARCLDQEGEAHALLFEFHSALDLWESASSKYDMAGVPAGSARCAFLAVRLKARIMGDYKDAESLIAAASELRASRDIEIGVELELLRAFVAYRTGRRDYASHVIAGLKGQEDWPARIRARVLVFGLIFELLDPSANLLEEIEEVISNVQPLSLRDSVLDWVEHAGGPVLVPANFLRRLIALFARPSFQSVRGTRLLIQRADLYRIFGMTEEAEAQLARAHDASLLHAWRLNLARQRLGQRTDFLSLANRFADSDFAGTPLHGALRVKAAWEALQDGNVQVAREILQGGLAELENEIPNVWQAYLLQARAEVAEPGSREKLESETVERYRSLGQTPTAAATDDRVVIISEQDVAAHVSESARRPELAIDLLMADWSSVAEDLGRVLRERNAQGAPIEPIGRLAALPWELAGVSCRESSKTPIRFYQSDDAQRPGAVRVVRPEVGEEEISHENVSGGQLEDVYHSFGIIPALSFNPDPERLYQELRSGAPPTLIHIIAAVREASGGTYLDFESTRHRAASFEIDSGISELSVTAFRLDRMLAALLQPPFVLLDVARPYNLTEAVRMVLLRNLFATQLFELGHVRGVLGCGLAQPWERLSLAYEIVEALIHNTVARALRRRREPAQMSLEEALPRLAAALWTNSPDDRLFKT